MKASASKSRSRSPRFLSPTLPYVDEPNAAREPPSPLPSDEENGDTTPPSNGIATPGRFPESPDSRATMVRIPLTPTSPPLAQYDYVGRYIYVGEFRRRIEAHPNARPTSVHPRIGHRETPDLRDTYTASSPHFLGRRRIFGVRERGHNPRRHSRPKASRWLGQVSGAKDHHGQRPL